MTKKDFSLNSFKITKKSPAKSMGKPAKEFTGSKAQVDTPNEELQTHTVETAKVTQPLKEEKKKRTSYNLAPSLLLRTQIMKAHTGRDVQDIVAEALDRYMSEEGF